MRSCLAWALLLAGCDAQEPWRPDAGFAGVEFVTDVCTPQHCPAHCPVLRDSQAADGGTYPDTWDNYARGFFLNWCVRCHSSQLADDSTVRMGAPFVRDGGTNTDTIMNIEPDWDVESAVRVYLNQAAPGQLSIRDHVGVYNDMPPLPPWPNCEERARLIRWIDSGAP